MDIEFYRRAIAAADRARGAGLSSTEKVLLEIAEQALAYKKSAFMHQYVRDMKAPDGKLTVQ